MKKARPEDSMLVGSGGEQLITTSSDLQTRFASLGASSPEATLVVSGDCLELFSIFSKTLKLTINSYQERRVVFS